MALSDLQLAFLTSALGIAPSAKSPAPAHGTAAPASSKPPATPALQTSPAQEALSFAQGVGHGVVDGGKSLVKGVVHTVQGIGEEAIALASSETARHQVAEAARHAVSMVGVAADTVVNDPAAAASAVVDATHRGIAAAAKVTQGMNRAVGEGAVAAVASTETLEGASTVSGAVRVQRAAGEGAAVAKQSVKVSAITEYRAISSGELAPNTIYKFDGMEFETDHLGRSVATRGKIDPKRRGQRMPEVDRAIGQHPDADPFDVGFHRGADALGFPGGKLNVNPGNGFPDPERFPDLSNLNQGAYKRVEAKLLALAKVPGNNVEAEFKAVFAPGNLSQRPDEFVVTYRVNGGKAHNHRLTNQPGG